MIEMTQVQAWLCEVIEVMGNDEEVENAARISYGEGHEEANKKSNSLFDET